MNSRFGTMKMLAGVLLLGVVGAACGKAAAPGAGDNGGGTYDAGDVILRMETEGGFVPPEYHLRNAPDFFLTGTGRTFSMGPQIEIFPPPALPPFVERTVTEEAVRKIVAEAKAAGLDGPDKHYDRPGVADAGTTVFVFLDENGKTHKISAYALGLEEGPSDGMSAEDREARAKLAKLAEKLRDLSAWIPAEDLGEEKVYEFTAMRVFVKDYPKSIDPPQQAKAWPLKGSLADFGAKYDGQPEPTRCGVVEGEDLKGTRQTFAQSNQLTPWTSDGKRYLLVLRPLLPGESGCPAAE